MNVQLILFPQNYKGAGTPIADPPAEFIMGDITTKYNSTIGTNAFTSPGIGLVQYALDFYYTGSGSPMPINQWVSKYQRVISSISHNSNGGPPNLPLLVLGKKQSGILQKMSGMTPGDTYEAKIDVWAGAGGLTYPASDPVVRFYHCYDDQIVTDYVLSNGMNTIQFTASTSSDICLIDFEDYSSTLTHGVIRSVSIKSLTQQTNYSNLVQNGQVICDLYEDEDIPMTFSIDDFKNVAEKVQSYSKAFKIPGTDHNNKIFDYIFDVTKSAQNTLRFNPYQKTRAILKQDGFLLFEGYIRLIEIQDQEGEVSYNVNLYSEVVALADILKERTFADLDFDELRHEYNKTTIKNSWYSTSGLPLINPLPTTSYAYSAALGPNETAVLKYPFVDWTHNYGVMPNNDPKLLSLDDTFRPWMQIVYIINKIFEPTPFQYVSNFISSDPDFQKLFMDFNWESRNIQSGGARLDTGDPTAGIYYTGSYQPIMLYNDDFPSDAGWDQATGSFTSSADGTTYTFWGDFYFANTAANTGVTWRWVHYDATGAVVTSQPYAVWGNSWNPMIIPYTVDFQITLDVNESIHFQFRNTGGAGYQTIPCTLYCKTGMVIVGTNVLAQTLRNDLNQWEFLKGIMTMFNLVSTPDPSDPNTILIEPYGDVFINNTNSGSTSDMTLASRGIAHDWTEKMDMTLQKLSPLTELNKLTNFIWEIDDDDYFFNLYKSSTNHDYGTLTYDASGFTLLEGEEEISGSPFAATLSKPLMPAYSALVVPTLYGMEDNGETKGIENSPRILYNNGRIQLPHTYYIPAQNGLSSENQQYFLQFSHLTDIPSLTTSRDYLWGEQDYSPGLGNTVVNNLFRRFWLPYYNELYHPDTKTLVMKIKLTPADIERFNLYDTVFLKQRQYRVNKIDYKPHDLSTVEFILIP